MSDLTRVNIFQIQSFYDNLAGYETTFPAQAVDPIQYVECGKHLQMALSRLVGSTPVDSIQMMRILMMKLIDNPSTAYSQYAILTMSSATVSPVLKDTVMAVLWNLLRLLNGEEIQIDVLWESRVNYNQGIVSFFKEYATSDIKRIYDTPKSQIALADPTFEPCQCDGAKITIEIGQISRQLTLTQALPQLLTFVKAEELELPEDFDSTKSLVLMGRVSVTTSLGQFSIDQNVKFTPGAKVMADTLGCISVYGKVGGDTLIQMPTGFMTCFLDIVSFTGGSTFEIGNISIVPKVSG